LIVNYLKIPKNHHGLQKMPSWAACFRPPICTIKDINSITLTQAW